MKKNLLIIIYILFFTNFLSAQSFVIYGDKCFGGSNGEFGGRMVMSNDGNLILSGLSASDISGNKTVGNCYPTSSPMSDMWVLKIDSLFNIIWQKELGGASGEQFDYINNNLNMDKILFSCGSSSDSSCQKSQNNYSILFPSSNDYWIGVLDNNGTIIWEKTIRGDGDDNGPIFIQLSTTEYLVCGSSNSNVGGDKTSPSYPGNGDYWMLKLDTLGNIIWDRTIGGNSQDLCSSLIGLNNGDFVVGGSTYSTVGADVSSISRGDMDYWIVKMDNAGNKIWDRRYGGIYQDKCTSLIATNDNGFLAGGWTVSPQGGDITEPYKGGLYNSDYWIVKLDSLGNKQWDKRFGGSGTEYLFSVQQAKDGGYLLVGTSGSNMGYDVTEPKIFGGGYWIVKIDSLGNKLWDKRLEGGGGSQQIQSFIELADSSIMVFGTADSGTYAVKTDPGYGGNDYWAVRFKYFPASVGIEEMNLFNQSVSVFPNPAKDFIKINSQNVPIKKIELVNLLGETLYSQTIENAQITQLNLQPYSPGFYFVKVSSEKYTVTKRLVKE